LAQAVTSLGHVAEGVYSARTVWQRAQSLGVDMPITEAVVALLDGRLQAREAVQVLMGRGPRDEAVQKAALPSSGVQLGVQFGV
jgi:glycerol-3-phosphate dehydrogenase (NAD(P)+)